MNPERRAARLKARATELGFASCGITDLTPPPHAEELRTWLARGMAGTMGYMPRQAARRLNPERIVPGATRAVVVSRNYYDEATSEGIGGESGRVARYAQGTDYHDALDAVLGQLADAILELGGPDAVARAFIDAGPVPERELGQRAGLGWIGKNTMLIDPHAGSFFFIGVVLTNVDLALDPPFEADRCGSCRLCLDACPTQAFVAERVLDANLCISYLTIEYRGDIDDALAGKMGDWIFGCDVCQDVCPWNHKFADATDDPYLARNPQLAHLNLADLSQMSADEFGRRFGSTALARPGASGMRRNATIAQRNAREQASCPTQS